MDRNGHFFFVLIFIFCVVVMGFSSSKRQTVKKLSDDFFTIDKNTQKPIPLFSYESSKKCYLILNADTYSGFEISFPTTSGLCLFVNNRLIYKAQKSDTVVHLPIVSLSPTDEKQLLLTFYSPKEVYPYQKVVVSKEQTVAKRNEQEVIKRGHERQGDVAVFLILILAVLGIVKNKDTALWKNYFSFSRLFSVRTNSDEYVLRSVFSTESLMLLSLLSLIISCVLNELHLEVFDFNFTALPTTVLNFTLIFLLLIVKYFFLKLVSSFLNIASFGTRQFYEFLRYLIWFSFIMLVIILGFKDNFHPILKLILWIGITLWNIKILSAALTRLRFQKLYLFSYICASELIPAIVLINFIEAIN